MANIFNSVLVKAPNRTTFDKSFKNKTTANIGQLFPIFCEEIVPSQRVQLSESHFIRVQPMLAPIFDNVKFKQYYFFVPNRLLNPDWELFRTGGKDQDFSNIEDFNEKGQVLSYWDSSNLSSYDSEIFKLLSYFGIPKRYITDYLNNENSINLNSLPIIAYYRIIFDYFLDEQKDSNYLDFFEKFFSFDERNFAFYLDFFENFSQNANFLDDNWHFLFRKRYGHDYFTSATESPQLGNALGLQFNPNSLSLSASQVNPLNLFTNIVSGNVGTPIIPPSINEDIFLYHESTDPSSQAGLYADISGQRKPLSLIGSTSLDQNALSYIASNIRIVGNSDIFTINDLRNSFLLQELLEKNNVSGFRYFEWIKSHFGVTSPDSSLQRSQFICSNSSVINFVEVEQNAPATDEMDTPQGHLAGRGVSGDSSFIIDREFTEDGFLIGLGCFVPEHTYNQGIPKMFLRKNGLDYLIPHFERLGEQPILNAELFYNNDSHDCEVFGYQSRYAEYKSRYNTQSGDFDDTLDFWTLTRKFDNLPNLDSQFLQINYEDFDNAFAVQDDSDKFLMVQAFNLQETLPLSRYAIPAQL